MIKTRKISLLAVCLLFMTSTVVMAQAPVISAEQVRAFMTGKNKAVLIDARTREEYEQAHLPGAISIPADRIKQERARLPKNKSTALIFYCRGLGCTLSRTAAEGALEMGYTYLMSYQAGMPDWLLKGYPMQKGDKTGKMK